MERSLYSALRTPQKQLPLRILFFFFTQKEVGYHLSVRAELTLTEMTQSPGRYGQGSPLVGMGQGLPLFFPLAFNCFIFLIFNFLMN